MEVNLILNLNNDFLNINFNWSDTLLNLVEPDKWDESLK